MSAPGVVLTGVIALLALLTVAGLLARRVMRRRLAERELLERIERLSWLARGRLARGLAGDSRIPLAVRLIPPLLMLYLLMPFDIIPDFIPVLGQLDDVIVLFIGVVALLRFVPRGVLEERLFALEQAAREGR
ncbi:MAG: DUF1232 domain-containing protein [Dehalococcoidia bacterium]|nr:DUF1232 domain-containing protein [Dehalococcoidia bacterium]